MNDNEHASAREKRDYMCFLRILRWCTWWSVDRSLSIPRISAIDTDIAFQMTFYFLFAASVLQLPHALRFSLCIRNHVRTIEVRLLNVRRIFHLKSDILRIYLYFIRGRRISNAQIDACSLCGKKLLTRQFYVCTVPLSLTRTKLRGGPLLKNIDRTDSLDFHYRRDIQKRIGNGGDKLLISAVFYARPNIHIPCSLESEACVVLYNNYIENRAVLHWK